MSEQLTAEEVLARIENLNEPDTAAIMPLPRSFRGPARWLRLDGAEGTMFEGFWAKVRTNLDGGEVAAIEAAGGTKWDLACLMAPHIRAWNYVVSEAVAVTLPAETITAFDGELIELPEREVMQPQDVPLPAPAEGGPMSLIRIDGHLFTWLRTMLCLKPYRINQARPGDESPEGKSPGRAKPTPAGTPAGTPTSRAASSTKSRRSRASSSTR